MPQTDSHGYRYRHGWIPLMSADQVAGDYEARMTLSPNEGDVLDGYCGSTYQAMNEQLRYGVGYPDMSASINTLSTLASRYQLPANAHGFRAVNTADFLPEGNATGTVLTAPGFSSVSLDGLDDRFRGRAVLMEISIPKGTSGIAAEGTDFGVYGEREFILPHNTRFAVESDVTPSSGPKAGQRHLKLTVVPDVPAPVSAPAAPPTPAYDDYDFSQF